MRKTRQFASMLLLACPFAATWAATTYTVLHSFPFEPKGANPTSGVIRDTAGNLYGTTFDGGSPASYGVVYKLDPAGHETVLYSFSGGADGGSPQAGVIFDVAGNLYGTTSIGGIGCEKYDNCGVVFELDPTGHETVLYRFTGGADGSHPEAGLILDAAGNLYGTTSTGGNADLCIGGCGVVFKLDPTGHETVLYTFTGGADGSGPQAGVILDAAGNLYGTTAEGGLSGCTISCGVVFKLDPTGHETVLHSFTGGADGGEPQAGVILDSAGNLYGTTAWGGGSGCPGDGGCGVIFKLDPTGQETVLHSFAGGVDGAYPVAGVILDPAGNLYGTTSEGGTGAGCAPFCGVVFKLDPTGQETVLHSFMGGADGDDPQAGVILDATGNLYGAASKGGKSQVGDVRVRGRRVGP